MFQEMTKEQHATKARASVRAQGAHDCIHFASRWSSRADALYAIMNAMFSSGDLDWTSFTGFDGLRTKEYGSPALIADGRMVVMGQTAWLFEAK